MIVNPRSRYRPAHCSVRASRAISRHERHGGQVHRHHQLRCYRGHIKSMRHHARASADARAQKHWGMPVPIGSARSAAWIRDAPAVRTHPLLAFGDPGVDAVHCAVRIRAAPGLIYFRRLCPHLPCERRHEGGRRQDSGQDRRLNFHCQSPDSWRRMHRQGAHRPRGNLICGQRIYFVGIAATFPHLRRFWDASTRVTAGDQLQRSAHCAADDLDNRHRGTTGSAWR